VHNQKVSAIIDFDFLGIGDPACDLLRAWSIFDTNTRQLFKETLGVNEATWLRGRGWALMIAVNIIPYYQYSNTTLTHTARCILLELVQN
jgi:aminoglycoside phosphotransferase (APT) family kinase protein